MAFLTRQEKFVVIFLIIGSLCGFSYSYYKKFNPPIDIKFKRPFREDTAQAKPFEDIIQEEKSVNINTASIDELIRLKGIGPAIAGRIVEYRNQNGSFGHIEDIKGVHGIGPKKFDDIKDLITVE